MSESEDLKEARKLLARLPMEERLQLFAENGPVCFQPPAKLKSEDLRKAEEWFWSRITTSRTAREKNARIRYWVIFLLLRYGGLRLAEIFELVQNDINLETGIIYIGGREMNRLAPLPPSVIQKIRAVSEEWVDFHLARWPLRCDSGQFRRCLARCARACGLENGLLNARSMRRNRGREIEHSGANAELADIFLGRSRIADHLDPDLANALIRKIVFSEDGQKTSARNRFSGKIIRIAQQGILARIDMETEAGPLTAGITEESRQNLGLCVGMRVNALIKAPFVKLGFSPVKEHAAQYNCYSGSVEKIRQDDSAREILLRISENITICALGTIPGKEDIHGLGKFTGQWKIEDVKPGVKLFASFSHFAVIIITV